MSLNIASLNFTKYDLNKQYINFNYPQQPGVLDDHVVVFPHNIYSGGVVPEPDNKAQWIDQSTVYFADADYVHPLHFSKFGRYNGCPYGYCYGSQSGRNYNVPPQFHIPHAAGEPVPANFWTYWNRPDTVYQDKTTSAYAYPNNQGR